MDSPVLNWNGIGVNPINTPQLQQASVSPPGTTTAISDVSSGPVYTIRASSRKRSFPEADSAQREHDSPPALAGGRRKASRACDFCKRRKIRCSGTIPCSRCTSSGFTCLYESSYCRGRPRTPPPSIPNINVGAVPNGWTQAATPSVRNLPVTPVDPQLTTRRDDHNAESQGSVSRASPELEMTEIQGQVFDPTSGLTFLHRAWKRLSNQDHNTNLSDDLESEVSVQDQPLLLAGDRPLHQVTYADVDKFSFPDPDKVDSLLALYFDVCIATYRMLHRPSVEKWLHIMKRNLENGRPTWQEIGRAKAAIVLTSLAVATLHDEKSKDAYSRGQKFVSPARSDSLFCVAYRLTEMETGFPQLESAQARLIQTIYLLMTSRSNLAWYNFGIALQIISALGLHRKAAKKGRLAANKSDYIQAQCQRRTFWSAYILDTHLGMVFGRPRHFHEDDIDQEFPDCIEDQDMAVEGPKGRTREQPDCLINALTFHAKIARIIGDISKEVYSIKPISEQERVAAAYRLGKEVNAWKESLPPHLGSVRYHMLALDFRRQSVVLKFAYYHAIVHANRLFLLGKLDMTSEPQVAECIGAARGVLELVDSLAAEGSYIHATWWIHYVTFCALVVSRVWDIQRRRQGISLRTEDDHSSFLQLAERCQGYLANATMSNSLSRRYAVILEEFRAEVTGPQQQQDPSRQVPQDSSILNTETSRPGNPITNELPRILPRPVSEAEAQPTELPLQGDFNQLNSHFLDDWQTTDWLDLDSAAFESFMDFSVNF
ncbi:hypothetical protein NM208_g4310 [Fusarium decemcellulare]|uniref:Uncharacterized protein n=1 Tax=Fusarium decemcellulare TaxID=57161 RepID=A0ACC1SLC3_9HYPO|nr:hypothetical protein NM208_g4310 [Fusarium decemcellulare]